MTILFWVTIVSVVELHRLIHWTRLHTFVGELRVASSVGGALSNSRSKLDYLGNWPKTSKTTQAIRCTGQVSKPRFSQTCGRFSRCATITNSASAVFFIS